MLGDVESSKKYLREAEIILKKIDGEQLINATFELFDFGSISRC